jgi:hypothetical protein
MILKELSSPLAQLDGPRPRPRIIELLNLSDYSHHVRCSAERLAAIDGQKALTSGL